MSDIIRVIRILEYVGTREAVEKTLNHGAVPMNGQEGYRDLTIRSAILGQFPEILEKNNDKESID